MSKVSTSSEPLDEEDQDLVIEQFNLDIDKQFKILRGIMVVLCVVWEVVICFAVVSPVHVCKIANAGTFIVHQQPFSCPEKAAWIIRAIGASIAITHLLSFSFLLVGANRLLQLGFYSFVIPVAILAYGYVTFDASSGPSMQEKYKAAMASDGPAVVDYTPNSRVDMNVLAGLLAAFLFLAALFHFLCGNVYSSRDDLRNQLQLLTAKKYKHKSL